MWECECVCVLTVVFSVCSFLAHEIHKNIIKLHHLTLCNYMWDCIVCFSKPWVLKVVMAEATVAEGTKRVPTLGPVGLFRHLCWRSCHCSSHVSRTSQVKIGLPAMLKGGVCNQVLMSQKLPPGAFDCFFAFTCAAASPRDHWTPSGHHGRYEQRAGKDCRRGWSLRRHGAWTHLGLAESWQPELFGQSVKPSQAMRKQRKNHAHRHTLLTSEASQQTSARARCDSLDASRERVVSNSSVKPTSFVKRETGEKLSVQKYLRINPLQGVARMSDPKMIKAGCMRWIPCSSWRVKIPNRIQCILYQEIVNAVSIPVWSSALLCGTINRSDKVSCKIQAMWCLTNCEGYGKVPHWTLRGISGNAECPVKVVKA